MKIELKRTAVPEEMGTHTCAICGDGFEVGTVTAWGDTEDSFACERCIEVLGNYRPDRFPTIGEYRRLEAEWPTPTYASGEEANAAFLAGL